MKKATVSGVKPTLEVFKKVDKWRGFWREQGWAYNFNLDEILILLRSILRLLDKVTMTPNIRICATENIFECRPITDLSKIFKTSLKIRDKNTK